SDAATGGALREAGTGSTPVARMLARIRHVIRGDRMRIHAGREGAMKRTAPSTDILRWKGAVLLDTIPFGTAALLPGRRTATAKTAASPMDRRARGAVSSGRCPVGEMI